MNSCTIIIFGVTGDLGTKKLIPALYKMVARKKLDKFTFVGVARDEITAQEMLDRGRKYIDGIDEHVWETLKAASHYKKLDFNNLQDYESLNTFVISLEQEKGIRNRLVHLAAAASFFCGITKALADSGVVQRLNADDTIWHRIIYEKPFGHDLTSAIEINACIKKSFEEAQIFRIDHFLTKELVGNIALIRFTNCVFEPLWNNRFIDSVEIILNEPGGINDRGGYYDNYGALRDVVQNHMFEILALVAMEAPEKLAGDYIREQRARVLKNVEFVDGILGQYDGYTKEKDVKSNSKTETFAALLLRINNPRWAGVPFYLKTGKKLESKQTAIRIKFKKVDCLLTDQCPSDSNYLTIRMAPDATFELELNAKIVGRSDRVAPVKMEFCHSCLFGSLVPDAYETLYEEVSKGDYSISVRFDEIEYAWKTIDTIYNEKLPLYSYKQGSAGPIELEQFSQKHGIRWYS